MGILEGKKILITGVLTEASIAYSVARLAQEEGAEIVLSSFGRMLPITAKIAERLPKPAQVIELDATNPEDLAAPASPRRHRARYRLCSADRPRWQLPRNRMG